MGLVSGRSSLSSKACAKGLDLARYTEVRNIQIKHISLSQGVPPLA
jgi:hypothetical protein